MTDKQAEKLQDIKDRLQEATNDLEGIDAGETLSREEEHELHRAFIKLDDACCAIDEVLENHDFGVNKD